MFVKIRKGDSTFKGLLPRLFAVLVLITSCYSSFSQKTNLKNKYPDATLKWGLRGYAGQNFQFFDHPFFKTETKKHSNIHFGTELVKCFGLEFIFPNQTLGKNRLIAGLYYTEAGMGYAFNVRSGGAVGVGGSGAMNGRLMCLGAGVGLVRTVPIIKKRLNLDLSTVLTPGVFFMDRFLADTTVENSNERQRPFFDPFAIIDMPPKLYSRFNLRLKNMVAISIRISRNSSLSIASIYNIGLPNKAFERSFYIYHKNDFSTPLSYEKAVFSNSSAEFNLGFSWRL